MTLSFVVQTFIGEFDSVFQLVATIIMGILMLVAGAIPLIVDYRFEKEQKDKNKKAS